MNSKNILTTPFPNLLHALACYFLFVSSSFPVVAARAQVDDEVNIVTSTPATKDLIEFLISREISGIYRAMVSDKATLEEKKQAVHQYHALIFMVWVGVVERKLLNIADVDIESFTRGFLRSINKLKLEQLVDWDDPIGWEQLRNGVSKEDVIEFHNQFKYLSWVYNETKDVAKYRAIVERFRKYCAEVSKKE